MALEKEALYALIREIGATVPLRGTLSTCCDGPAVSLGRLPGLRAVPAAVHGHRRLVCMYRQEGIHH